MLKGATPPKTRAWCPSRERVWPTRGYGASPCSAMDTPTVSDTRTDTLHSYSELIASVLMVAVATPRD